LSKLLLIEGAVTDIQSRGYKNQQVLLSTEWVAENLKNPSIRLVESNEDMLLYRSGHIEGAVEIDWTRDLNHQVRRDYLDGEMFSQLCSRSGIARDTTVIFYGDKNNWWATYAFWLFKLFGHEKCAIMDGGRLKWEQEGREFTKSQPNITATKYPLLDRNDEIYRIFRDGVLKHIERRGKLIDVRSPEEFSGERLHMPNYPNEGALRGGHIPGARSVPWARAVNPEDGCFKDASSLRAIYENEAKLNQNDDVVVYCRIGERSSHTWFVLHYLLGYQNVRNYDGSWTEWGNLVNVPVER